MTLPHWNESEEYRKRIHSAALTIAHNQHLAGKLEEHLVKGRAEAIEAEALTQIDAVALHGMAWHIGAKNLAEVLEKQAKETPKS